MTKTRFVEILRTSARWRFDLSREVDGSKEARRKWRRNALALQRAANQVEAWDDSDPELEWLSRLGGDRLDAESMRLIRYFGMGYGSWQDGVQTNLQITKFVRRVAGVENQARGVRRREQEETDD